MHAHGVTSKQVFVPNPASLNQVHTIDLIVSVARMLQSSQTNNGHSVDIVNVGNLIRTT